MHQRLVFSVDSWLMVSAMQSAVRLPQQKGQATAYSPLPGSSGGIASIWAQRRQQQVMPLQRVQLDSSDEDMRSLSALVPQRRGAMAIHSTRTCTPGRWTKICPS